MEESVILNTLKQQKDANKKRIQDLEEKKLDLIAQVEDLEDENNLLKSEKAEVESQLEDLQEEYDILENEVYELRDKIQKMELKHELCLEKQRFNLNTRTGLGNQVFTRDMLGLHRRDLQRSNELKYNPGI